MPAILVIAIGVVSAIVLSQNGNAGTNPMTIKVFAQQFAWRFEYPDRQQPQVRASSSCRSTAAIKFELESADVIHSFWIPRDGPEAGPRARASRRTSSITPTRTGTFTLICTELCGLGHATMRAPVRVVSQEDFAAWVKEQQAGGGKGDSGAAVFASAGCGGCHTFTPAGTNGAIGPNLDNLAADAKKAGEDPAAYVRESIVNPNAVIAPGYAAGVMPGSFGKSLSAEEIDALVTYLTAAK